MNELCNGGSLVEGEVCESAAVRVPVNTVTYRWGPIVFVYKEVAHVGR